jgi:hypothetical protein
MHQRPYSRAGERGKGVGVVNCSRRYQVVDNKSMYIKPKGVDIGGITPVILLSDPANSDLNSKLHHIVGATRQEYPSLVA